MSLDQKKIKELLNKEDPVILEIGAHKGVDTKRFLEEFEKISIYCFEPDPRCIKVFKNNINDKRCALIEAAVSNKDGNTILHMSSGYNPGRLSRFYNLIKTLHLENILINEEEEWDFSSSIKKSISNSKKYPWLTFNKEVIVKTIMLDTWVKENNISYIDFIWADVQGSEKDMIEGAANTLKIVKYLFTEYGEKDTYPEALSREETITQLKKYDFELVPAYSSKEKRGDLLFKNKSF